MKKSLSFLVSFIVIVAWTIVLHADDKFRFAVFSDSRGKVDTKSCSDDNGGISSVLPIVRDHVLMIHKATPIRLVLFPGDLVSGSLPRDAASTAECNKIQLGSWRDTMKPIMDKGIMMRVTVGNHDVKVSDPTMEQMRCGDHSRPYLTSYDNFVVFREILHDLLLPDQGPRSDLGLTYSFDVDDSHFAVISSYNMLENNSFSNETLQWLDYDLMKASRKGSKLFVASHAPAFPGGRHMWDSLPFYDPSYTCSDYSGIDRRKERDRFWNILKKHDVIAYFCGHEHNTQIQQVEGIWHVLVGGLTEELHGFNGAAKGTKPNTILYDGHLQNPRASVNWPLDEKEIQSHWGWALVTVDKDQVTMDFYGSSKKPQSIDDFRQLKSFTLWESVKK